MPIKIAWVADFTVKTYKAGGAQYTNDMLINAGLKRGYKIDIITPKEQHLINNYDFFILNNIRFFQKSILNHIFSNKKYMRFEHDYWVPGALHQFPQILNNSKLNLFMSKRHIEETEKRMNSKIPRASYCTSPIDITRFYLNPKIKKDDRLVVWTGHDVPENKGIENLFAYALNSSKIFKLFGIFKKFTNENTPDNIEIMGEHDQESFRNWLWKAKYLMACPNWVEPSGRSVIEGMLCGCKLIVNDNIGFLGEDIDFNDYESIRKAAQTEDKFWKLIEGVML